MNKFSKKLLLGATTLAVLAGGFTASAAGFQEYPIGDEQEDL